MTTIGLPLPHTEPDQDRGYAEWALHAHEKWVAPRLAALIAAAPDPAALTASWMAECGPGGESGRCRLFPGSFFLLWVRALGADATAESATWVAAAIELVHNATLVHDDVLDGHQARRGQATLLARTTAGEVLLAGDWLFAAAFTALGRAGTGAAMAACVERLADAASQVAVGQRLDEPDAWAGVPWVDRWPHWLRVCHGKLAVGNAGAAMAAVWADRPELEPTLMALVTDFSVVSQIINDFGDALGFAGYHALGRSGRPAAEEAARKPTLPVIWGADPASRRSTQRLLPRGHAEIARRRRRALERLNRLQLAPAARGLLLDFIERPSLAPYVG